MENNRHYSDGRSTLLVSTARAVFVLYCLVTMLFITAHSWIAATVIAISTVLLLLPKQKVTQSVGQVGTRLAHGIASGLLIFVICKPYQIPISTTLILSKDEGEGYVTNYYDVSYYAPNSPVLFVKIDDNATNGIRYARGWVRYSPLDFLSISHQRVIKVKNLDKNYKIKGSSAGKS